MSSLLLKPISRKNQCLEYLARRIWQVDFCLRKYYTVICLYSIITYCIIDIFSKQSHIMSKHSNCISWYSILFYCRSKLILFQTFLFRKCIFICHYWRFFWIPLYKKIVVSFYPTTQSVYLPCLKWILLS